MTNQQMKIQRNIEHKSPISGVAAMEGRFVATAGYDNQVILWEHATKTALRRIVHDHLANSCSFSPCGTYLATASSDHTARLYTVKDFKLLAVLGEHQDDVECVAFHPSAEKVATASRDRTIRIFDYSGRLLQSCEGHTDDVNTVVWKDAGNKLVSTSDDGTIRTWNPLNGECLDVFSMAGVQTDTICLSSEGVLFSGDDEGRISIIFEGVSQQIQAHDAGIKRLCFDAASGYLASLSYDRKCKVWNLQKDLSLQEVVVTDLPALIWPRSCVFLNESTLVFGTFGSSYATFDILTKEWDLSEVSDTLGVNAVACDETGTRHTVGDAGVYASSSGETTRLGSLCNFVHAVDALVFSGGQLGIVFEAKSGKNIYQHRSPLNCASSLKIENEHAVVVGTYTGEALVFSVKNEKVSFVKSIKVFENAIKSLSLTEDFLFAVCATGEAAFWPTSGVLSNVEVSPSKYSGVHERIANSCCAVEKRLFASVSRDLKLRLWNPEQGCQEVFTTPHQRSIKCMASKGNYICTGAYDGSVAVFDVQQRKWVQSLRPTAAGISSLCTSEEGFLASSYDGNLYEIQMGAGANANLL